jgi:hypothetical protein
MDVDQILGMDSEKLWESQKNYALVEITQFSNYFEFFGKNVSLITTSQLRCDVVKN